LESLKAHLGPFAALVLSLVACGGTEEKSPSAPGGAGAAGSSSESTRGTPTWHADIAPLVAERCAGCHVDGGIAPFSLQTYEQAKMWSATFEAPLRAGTMPPFLARETNECQPRFGFRDDPRLSHEQIELFTRWNDAGCPEGDATTAAPLPEPVRLDLADAELEVKIPSPVTVEGTRDSFICFSLAPDFSPLKSTGPEAALLGDNVLIDGAQVHPGNSAVVHHVLVYTDREGKSAALAGEKGYYDCFGGPQLDSPGLLMAWAPGSTPVTAPEGVAMALPSTGRIVLQVHYHPSGAPQVDDSTSVQLRRYRAGIPEYIGSLSLIGNARGTTANGLGLQPGPNDEGGKPEFRIPAGAVGHTESMLFPLPRAQGDYKVWAVGSHMHYVGTNMRIGITRAAPGTEPAEECLLETPDWDFNWQRGYLYDAPISQAPTARAGDIFNLRCTYDNSMGNQFVQSALAEQGLSAPRDVRLGEATLDEMCLGIFGLAQKVSDLLK
jgi:hypothetical protein